MKSRLGAPLAALVLMAAAASTLRAQPLQLLADVAAEGANANSSFGVQPVAVVNGKALLYAPGSPGTLWASDGSAPARWRSPSRATAAAPGWSSGPAGGVTASRSLPGSAAGACCAPTRRERISTRRAGWRCARKHQAGGGRDDGGLSCSLYQQHAVRIWSPRHADSQLLLRSTPVGYRSLWSARRQRYGASGSSPS